jgi:hypothetical protein
MIACFCYQYCHVWRYHSESSYCFYSFREGFNREGSVEARGIIPRAIEQIFGHIQRYASPRMRFLVRASYLQIYNEAISDLLKPERSNLTIREDKKRGVYVDGLSEWVVRSPAEIYGLMERGGAVRATGETKMNEVSSRSHAVFIVIAEQSETVYVDEQGVEMSPEDFQKFMHGRGVHREQEMSRLEDHVKQSFKVGKLNLVDLAGSERVRLSGATGQRLEESKQINRSLSALGNVISALTDAKARQHIPYRDSKLTRMLEDSLGGNCKTTMMAMISPALEAMLETISTLKFANRAKNIRNEAKVNEDLDQKSLLRKYERELKKLRAELEERSKNVVDKRRLLELDEQVNYLIRYVWIGISICSLYVYTEFILQPYYHLYYLHATLTSSSVLVKKLRLIRWELLELLKPDFTHVITFIIIHIITH